MDPWNIRDTGEGEITIDVECDGSISFGPGKAWDVPCDYVGPVVAWEQRYVDDGVRRRYRVEWATRTWTCPVCQTETEDDGIMV